MREVRNELPPGSCHVAPAGGCSACVHRTGRQRVRCCCAPAVWSGCCSTQTVEQTPRPSCWSQLLSVRLQSAAARSCSAAWAACCALYRRQAQAWAFEMGWGGVNGHAGVGVGGWMGRGGCVEVGLERLATAPQMMCEQFLTPRRPLCFLASFRTCRDP